MRTARHATNAPARVLRLGVALLALVGVAPAAAKPALIITGAGLGHGIGMSQYGADGFAQHGYDYETILGHYYAATTLMTVSRSTVVHVLLQSGGAPSVRGASRAGGHTLVPTARYTVGRSGSKLTLTTPSGRVLGPFTAPLKVSGHTPIELYGTAQNGVRNGSYRGALEFRPASGGGVQSVNAAPIEDYVRGVVAAEVPSSWPAAALEAQAVAARGYGIAAPVRGNGYTQYADTRSQQYDGVKAETPATNAAVRATAGQVVGYLGKPVATFFFSSSGGETEDVQNVFLGTDPDPWLTAVDDPYDSVSPDHRWGPIDLSSSQVSDRLGGLLKGHFEAIHVTQRGVSPRIVSAQVVGTGGTTTVTGPELAQRFGLDDTWAYFSTNGHAVPVPSTPTGPTAPTPTTPTGPPTGGVTPTTTVPATTTPAPTTPTEPPTGGVGAP